MGQPLPLAVCLLQGTVFSPNNSLWAVVVVGLRGFGCVGFHCPAIDVLHFTDDKLWCTKSEQCVARVEISLTSVSFRRAAAPESTNGATGEAPEPVIKIDNQSDPFATIVSIEYGDLLGELLDTVRLLVCSMCVVGIQLE